MLQKTRGIVLNTFKYSENSLIVKVYTEQFGLQSYITNYSKSKTAKIKVNLFQPLMLLDLVVYHKEKSSLHRISEVKVNTPYQFIYTDTAKSCILLFLNDILYKCLKEEEQNEAVFDFIYNSLLILDLKQEQYATFHLAFMLQFTKFLGFFPQNNFSQHEPFFDLNAGSFTNRYGAANATLNEETSALLSQLIHVNYNLEDFSATHVKRKHLLNALILYYQLHIANFTQPKSLEVLESVLD